MLRADSLEKTMMLEKIEGRRRRGQQRMRWFDDMTDPMDVSLSKLLEMLKDREAWHAAVHGSQKVRQDWATKQQQFVRNRQMRGKSSLRMLEVQVLYHWPEGLTAILLLQGVCGHSYPSHPYSFLNAWNLRHCFCDNSHFCSSFNFLMNDYFQTIV